MRYPVPLLGLLAVATLAGCGRKRDVQAQVRECSAISLDARSTAQCLVQLYQWKADEATRAAIARHHEMDSLKTWQQDSVWNLTATKHRNDLANCRRSADPLDRCLIVAGWPLARVHATADSLWQAELPEHRRELQTCQARRDVNLASCLTLYYKWDSDRALRTADSITRARLGGVRR
ncbi:MAG TPA: hypothetical protein VGQ06_02105 [Gemmatimonadales bacterium]|jgi:hypothetical protein|nr:hypothetical protein [Gemmatimonadales bacterium]